nr:hypothetical protein [Tanacetum cinerariifolium]
MASFCVVPPPNYLVVCRTYVPVFTNYVVLGDDVVITDENVATRYKESLDLLQVVISKEKSLISRSGSAEFAKNFRVRDLTVDLSLVSIKALGGAGYLVLASLDHRRYSHLVVMGLTLLSPSYPLDFWLGKGRPLSPEAHGHLSGCLALLEDGRGGRRPRLLLSGSCL